jgi:hypothetical protein
MLPAPGGDALVACRQAEMLPDGGMVLLPPSGGDATGIGR